MDLHVCISEEPTAAIQPARDPLLRLLRPLLLRVLLLVPDVSRAPKSWLQHVVRFAHACFSSLYEGKCIRANII